MTRRKIKISNMKDIDAFNKLCSKFDCDMDLVSGKYYVNAKSVMGIFSLDLDLPLELIAGTDDDDAIDEAFKEYII
jgi:phosphotransferase system HPr-like phosphotransfer protein